jgi:hypothetical protein
VPKYLIVVLTAFGGAFTAITGVALIIGRLEVDELQGGAFGAHSTDELGWLFVVAAIVLGVVGLFYQMRSTIEMEELAVDAYQNPGMARQTSPY